MAIMQVTASLGENSTVLSDSGSSYSGNIVAPQEEGNYIASINVYDDSGNVSVATRSVVVSDFIPAKTNWVSSDRFNIQDYNRILGNIEYLHKYGCRLIGPFEIKDMGKKLDSYAGYWEVKVFNAFEDNIDILNQNILNRDFGIKQVFYENGIFIGYQELNRIEGAILNMKATLDTIKAGLRRIPFRLGTYRQMRI